MKDTDQLIEQIHHAGRQRLEQDCTQEVKPSPRTIKLSQPLWRYAAMIAAVAVVALLLFPIRQQQTMPVVANNELPNSVKQQIETARKSNTQPPITSGSSSVKPGYAYSETSDGVRVYCEDNCNADEVVDRMKQVIKTLQ